MKFVIKKIDGARSEDLGTFLVHSQAEEVSEFYKKMHPDSEIVVESR